MPAKTTIMIRQLDGLFPETLTLERIQIHLALTAILIVPIIRFSILIQVEKHTIIFMEKIKKLHMKLIVI